jgi:hypothetical protein
VAGAPPRHRHLRIALPVGPRPDRAPHHPHDPHRDQVVGDHERLRGEQQDQEVAAAHRLVQRQQREPAADDADDDDDDVQGRELNDQERVGVAARCGPDEPVDRILHDPDSDALSRRARAVARRRRPADASLPKPRAGPDRPRTSAVRRGSPAARRRRARAGPALWRAARRATRPPRRPASGRGAGRRRPPPGSSDASEPPLDPLYGDVRKRARDGEEERRRRRGAPVTRRPRRQPPTFAQNDQISHEGYESAPAGKLAETSKLLLLAGCLR